MTKQSEIPLALDLHLSTMPGLPDVAWPNTDFNFDADVIYVRPQLAISRNAPIGIEDSGELYNNGMYQIDIFAPKSNGIGTALALAQTIADHFAKGTELPSSDVIIRIGLSDVPNVGTNVGSHYQFGLLIYYTSIISGA